MSDTEKARDAAAAKAAAAKGELAGARARLVMAEAAIDEARRKIDGVQAARERALADGEGKTAERLARDEADLGQKLETALLTRKALLPRIASLTTDAAAAHADEVAALVPVVAAEAMAAWRALDHKPDEDTAQSYAIASLRYCSVVNDSNACGRRVGMPSFGAKSELQRRGIAGYVPWLADRRLLPPIAQPWQTALEAYRELSQ
jgi:hypothetical protein